MKRSFIFILIWTMLPILSLTAFAQQTVAPTVPPARARGAGQQPLRDAAKAAKQANQEQRRLSADQPKLNQQQRNRIANAVVDRYLGGVQKQVGLTDEQTRKISPNLGNYVRRQLVLAQTRTEAMNRLKELSDQQASQDEIQTLNKVVETTEAQQVNAQRRFYADINPQLTVQQQANLKLYLEKTSQNIRQAIQKSTQ